MKYTKMKYTKMKYTKQKKNHTEIDKKEALVFVFFL